VVAGDENSRHGRPRFDPLSFSRYNTEEDVDRIIEVFPAIVANLRKISPYWDQEKNAPDRARKTSS